MGKFQKQLSIITGALLLVLIPSFAFAAPAATTPAAPTAAPDAATPGAPVKKNRYRKSRLTHETSEAMADHRRLLLATGEDRAVDLSFDVEGGANGITVGNPQVVLTTLVKVGDQRRQVIFKPLKGGETTVTIRDPDGSIRLIFTVVVTGSNLLRRASEIRDLLRDIEGLDIRVVGQKVVVDGEVLVPADYGRLVAVVSDKAFSDLVLNLAVLSPLAMQVMAKRIQDDINAFAHEVRTRVVNGMIFLEGTVDSLDQARRAENIANLYLPDVRPGNLLVAKDPTAQIIPARKLVYSFIVVNPPPPKKQEKLVRVTVNFVELAKDYNKVFGFKWAPGFTSDPQISVGQTGTGAAGASGASFSGTISALFPKLISAQAAGYARILKTGTIVVRSGQNAVLSEGTQFPFTTLGPNGQPTGAFKDVKFDVAVTPVILGQSEDIQLDLDLSQDSLTGRAPAGAAPITSHHHVKTKIYVKSDESAAVAGAMSADVGTDFNKDDPDPRTAGTGGIKELFNLMRSKSYRKKKSQFVIFVTPQIVENASDGTEDLKRNFRVKAH